MNNKCTTRTSSAKPTQHTTSTCQAMTMRHWPHCIHHPVRKQAHGSNRRKIGASLVRETATRGAGGHTIFFTPLGESNSLQKCFLKYSNSTIWRESKRQKETFIIKYYFYFSNWEQKKSDFYKILNNILSFGTIDSKFSDYFFKTCEKSC